MAASDPAQGAGNVRRCKVCDTANAPNLRYCTACGSMLEPAPVMSPSAAPAASAIPPMRVVDVGTPAAPEQGRTCSRCRGAADASAQFCKFCGNPLHDAAALAAANDPPRPNGSPSFDDLPRAPARGPTAPMAQMSRAQPAPSPSPIGPSAPQAGGAAAALAAIPRPASVPPPRPASPSRSPGAAAPQRGRLVVIAKSGADGPSYPFGDVLDIGRTEGHVVVAEDPYLSPRHVRILWKDGKLLLRDLASTNGVYLRLAASRDTSPRKNRDAPEITVPLSDGDLILVGQQVLKFEVLREAEGGLGPAQEHGTLLFGSPAAPRYARLCQRTVEGIARDVYYVRKVETVLGRESGDVVFTEDPFLSRRHAAIRLLSRDGAPYGSAVARPPPEEPRFALVDLGSSNGTFLRIRSDVELAPGDHFRVGQQLFRVDFDAHARA
jgi:pSer/pThr/pTyr-binding forkhead associated (FHA) protein